MFLQLGSIPSVVVSSSEMAREVLKTHDLDLCSRPRLVATDRYSYNSVDVSFSPYGEYWREMRKLFTVELFGAKRAPIFRAIREDEMSKMIEAISRSSPSSSSSSSAPINLSKTMVDLANNIICRVALGKKYQEREAEDGKLQKIFNELQVMLCSFYVEDYFPSMGWIDKLRGLISRLERNVRELDAFYEQLILEHVGRERTARSDQEDVVDALLRLSRDNKEHLTNDNIKALISDIFVAGTETAAAAMTWAVAELIKNPELMKKAQNEVRTVVGPKGKVEEDDLPQLPYLKSVIKETFRLHPPVPLLLIHEAIRHCSIGGYDVLPRMRVYVNAWAIGRDPGTWKDPEVFNPERFTGSAIDYKGHDFELIPFGSGRRICPGMGVGSTSVELAVANLVYSFDWELPEGMRREEMDMEELPGMTMHKRSGLQLVAMQHHHTA
ncbi:cytochrome P450 71A1-like [Ananas comosus]|nr:cytochrome P450 71A1-like [Ananas comosus]